MSGKKRLLALRQRVKKANQRTLETREEVRAKRASRRRPQAQPDEVFERPKRPANSTTVYGWLKGELKAKYGQGFIIPDWSVKQKTLAKKILNTYGEDLTKEAVEHFVSNWDGYVEGSRGRLKGVPNINLFYGMREMVFGEVQTKHIKKTKTKDSDEHSDESAENAPNVGW